MRFSQAKNISSILFTLFVVNLERLSSLIAEQELNILCILFTLDVLKFSPKSITQIEIKGVKFVDVTPENIHEQSSFAINSSAEV